MLVYTGMLNNLLVACRANRGWMSMDILDTSKTQLSFACSFLVLSAYRVVMVLVDVWQPVSLNKLQITHAPFQSGPEPLKYTPSRFLLKQRIGASGPPLSSHRGRSRCVHHFSQFSTFFFPSFSIIFHHLALFILFHPFSPFSTFVLESPPNGHRGDVSAAFAALTSQSVRPVQVG